MVRWSADENRSGSTSGHRDGIENVLPLAGSKENRQIVCRRSARRAWCRRAATGAGDGCHSETMLPPALQTVARLWRFSLGLIYRSSLHSQSEGRRANFRERQHRRLRSASFGAAVHCGRAEPKAGEG